VLRGINGSLNWIANQSKPDLAVQTSPSQQCFPNPTIGHLKEANNAIRRAKQHKDVIVTPMLLLQMWDPILRRVIFWLLLIVTSMMVCRLLGILQYSMA
jgi:hypothetical protein